MSDVLVKYVVSYLRNSSLDLISQETTKLRQAMQGELTTVTYIFLVEGLKKMVCGHYLPTRLLQQDIVCAGDEVVIRGGGLPVMRSSSRKTIVAGGLGFLGTQVVAMG